MIATAEHESTAIDNGNVDDSLNNNNSSINNNNNNSNDDAASDELHIDDDWSVDADLKRLEDAVDAAAAAQQAKQADAATKANALFFRGQAEQLTQILLAIDGLAAGRPVSDRQRLRRKQLVRKLSQLIEEREQLANQAQQQQQQQQEQQQQQQQQQQEKQQQEKQQQQERMDIDTEDNTAQQEQKQEQEQEQEQEHEQEEEQEEEQEMHEQGKRGPADEHRRAVLRRFVLQHKDELSRQWHRIVFDRRTPVFAVRDAPAAVRIVGRGLAGLQLGKNAAVEVARERTFDGPAVAIDIVAHRFPTVDETVGMLEWLGANDYAVSVDNLAKLAATRHYGVIRQSFRLPAAGIDIDNITAGYDEKGEDKRDFVISIPKIKTPKKKQPPRLQQQQQQQHHQHHHPQSHPSMYRFADPFFGASRFPAQLFF